MHFDAWPHGAYCVSPGAPKVSGSGSLWFQLFVVTVLSLPAVIFNSRQSQEVQGCLDYGVSNRVLL